jgi:hypothetical protein
VPLGDLLVEATSPETGHDVPGACLANIKRQQIRLRGRLPSAAVAARGNHDDRPQKARGRGHTWQNVKGNN